MDLILKIMNLSKVFGGLMALREVSLQVEAGKIVGIIGPNGAGKTTLFNCLTSLYSATKGQIFLGEQPLLPEISGTKVKLIQQCALLFFLISLAWLPLSWSFFLPHTFYKLELTLLGIFLLGIRLLVARKLRRFQIWAWGVMFVLLGGDGCLAVWWLTHPSKLGHLAGTGIPLAYFAIPWSVFVTPFSVFLIRQLLVRKVRQLYGFRMGPDAITRAGVARTFQNIRLFLNLSVLDNVKIGSHAHLRSGLFSTLLRTRLQRKEEGLIEAEAMEQLRFVGLQHRVFDLAGSLAYGEQRRLEIARALATKPNLLLLDEPAAGMNPQESSRLIQLIGEIRKRGVTVLIIEHDMKVMMNLADYIYALDHGVLIAQGTPDEIRENPRVIEAYLGRGAAHA